MATPPPGRRPGVSVDPKARTFDPGGQPVVHREKHLHLSLFAWNVQNGLSASKYVLRAPERMQRMWEWPSSSGLMTDIEAAGFDSQLQYGMWSGYGGATGWNDYQLDFVTGATASAAVTNRIGIYTTIHVGYEIPPLMIAKVTATIDHISNGRLGVNIVAGQNPVDYAQFGLVGPPSQQIRYAIAEEMTLALKYLWTSDEPIDFEGEYFQFYGAQILPRATSRPRPLLISAAGSDIGLDYATRQCDALFITSSKNTLDGFTSRAAKIHTMAAEHDRAVRIAAMCYVVMEETEAAAEEVRQQIIDEIDDDALRTWLLRSGAVLNSQETKFAEAQVGSGRDAQHADVDRYLGIGQEEYEKLGMGMGAYQLIGSYSGVAEQLIDLYEAGIGQVALCFLDPQRGIQQMRDHVIPILAERGYHQN